MDDEVYAFINKPIKDGDIWIGKPYEDICLVAEEVLKEYPLISWEDEEPTRIKKDEKSVKEYIELLKEMQENSKLECQGISTVWEVRQPENVITDYDFQIGELLRYDDGNIQIDFLDKKELIKFMSKSDKSFSEHLEDYYGDLHATYELMLSYEMGKYYTSYPYRVEWRRVGNNIFLTKKEAMDEIKENRELYNSSATAFPLEFKYGSKSDEIMNVIYNSDWDKIKQ